MKTVVTGGASGIGYELSKLYPDTFVIDIQSPEHPVPGVSYLEADVTKPDQIVEAMTNIGTGIELLVCNAGIMKRGDILKPGFDAFSQIIDVNVKGYWNTIKAARAFLSNNATILINSSTHAIQEREQFPGAYRLSKVAVTELAKQLREFDEFRVKTMFPGPVITPMNKPVEDNERLSPSELSPLVKDLLEGEHDTLLYSKENGYQLTNGW